MAHTRSDVLEHEVLPVQGQRFAITCWIYGRPLQTIPPRGPRLPGGLASALGFESLAIKSPVVKSQR